ncbi:glycerophosphodiester phosphodiesterase [Nostoc sp. 3335mG]|nr:glycerophosphodiester phosphodiesterase [Nostoc sp. 3335mG]
MASRFLGTIGAVLAVALATPGAAQVAGDHSSVRAMSSEPRRPIVVAHRGCHNAAPSHQLGEAPENSRRALEQCVSLGVDMMETDIRRTADGYLVIMHDATVDRTTNGRGKVSDLTLVQIRTLRLRQNEGNYDHAATDQRVLTLDELLALAKGRITINLDVKEQIYSEVADAVHRAGMDDGVTIKTVAGIGSQSLAAIPPFDRLPFIAILDNGKDQSILPRIAEQQMATGHPVAFELPHMPASGLAAITAVTAPRGVPIFVNTLGDGFLSGLPADNSPARERDEGWAELLRDGVTFIQTDYPEALNAFLSQRRH